MVCLSGELSPWDGLAQVQVFGSVDGVGVARHWPQCKCLMDKVSLLPLSVRVHVDTIVANNKSLLAGNCVMDNDDIYVI